MTFIDKLSRLLLTPPVTGARALLYGLFLVVLPTFIRWSVDAYVNETGFSPYFPFILLAAVLLATRYAIAVALVSGVVGDLLFVGAPHQIMESPTDLFGFVVFLVSAVLIIALVEAVRVVVENSLRPTRPDEFTTPVIFSREDGQAWASWYGSHSWVRLGPEDAVADMMRDYLAQIELGRRLDWRSAENPGASS